MGGSAATPQAKGRVSLRLPVDLAFLGVLLSAVEAMAVLAGLGPDAARRARLMTEELFALVSSREAELNLDSGVGVELEAVADGLAICFSTQSPVLDPDSLPEHSLADLLAGCDEGGLGMCLVKTYASGITFTRRGPERELCLVAPRHEDEAGGRPWTRLVPTLAEGVKLTPIEHEGRRAHRLDHGPGGKTYLVRALAFEVISRLDGEATFGRIRDRVLQVLPGVGRDQVEELFELLIGRGLVNLRLIPREPAEIAVQEARDHRAVRALAAYQRASEEE